jgi:Domain of unknown function (DUF4124)
MKNTVKTLTLAAAVALALPAHAAFKCVDEKGRTHIGDTPPDPCANVVMYEVTRSGQVLRTIQPTLTEEQAKARIAEDERRKEAEKAANEQKRKDLALLATFSSETEFDVVRDRNIEPINGRIKSAQERMAAIDKRNKELEDELEFYKAGKSSKSSAKKTEAPPMMVEEQARLRHEKQTLAKNVVLYEKEIVEMRAKFDVDKRRWIALKGGAGAAAEAKPAEPKAVEVKADAKAAPKKK